MIDMKNYEKSLNDNTFRDYYYKLKMLAKGVFKWDGLPNNIDERWIEEFLFSEGRCIFFNDSEKGFMVAKCTDSGIVNFYEEPTKLSPVAVNYDNAKEYINGVECVVIKNNDESRPTASSVLLYAYRLADITRTIDINISAQKTPTLITCSKNQLVSLRQVYRQWNGFEPVIYGSKDLDLSGVSVLKTDAPIVFDKLQIQKHQIWNECMTFLGVNNANMDKRERLVDDEVQANNEQVDLFAEIALKSRKIACETINKIFGTNISVCFRTPEKAENEEIEPIESEV